MSEGRGRWFNVAADVVLVFAALIMVGFYIADRPQYGTPPSAQPTAAPENWRDEISTGIRVGPKNAKLTIIEFMDFECPFCARWAARVDSLLEEYPSEVQLVVQHYPLPNHANAVPAAVAAECADQQGQYLRFQRVLFAYHAQLGVKPWMEFAAESAIPDLERFRRCIAMPRDSFPRITYGVELGKRVGIRGTPTVWVNGVVRQSTLDELRTMLAQANE